MNIYQVTEQLQLAIDNLEIDRDGFIGEPMEQVFSDTLEGLYGELGARHKDFGAMIKNLEYMSDQMDVAVCQLDYRKDLLDRKIEYIKKYLLNSMVNNKIKSHKFPEFDIVTQESNRVVINDASSIPEQFIRRKETVEPDKSMLRQHLKEHEVPGATLEKFQSVQVK